MSDCPDIRGVVLDAARLSEIRDLLTYESSISFHSNRAHESMWLLHTEVQRLTAEIALKDQAPDEIKALHKNWYEVGGVRHEMRVYSAEPPAGHVCLNPGDSPYGDVCDAEDGEHYVLACVECTAATDDGEPGYRLWPCDTQRILTRLDTQGETK